MNTWSQEEEQQQLNSLVNRLLPREAGNNKSRCFALQVALSHLDHFLSVPPSRLTSYIINKQIYHPKQFRTDRLKTMELAVARLTSANA